MAATKGAIHEDLTRKDEIVGPSDRKFGFQVGGAFVLLSLALLSIYRFRHSGWVNESGWGPWPWWMLGLGILLLIAAAAMPGALRPFNKAWMGLAAILFIVINPIVMGLLWIVMMTPMGWFARFVMRKDLLRMQIDRQAASYWIVRDPPGPSPASMKNQF